MKKIFGLAVIAMLAMAVAGCVDTIDNIPEGQPEFTIINESSYVLTGVTFSGVPFASPGSNDLLISGQAVRTLESNAQGGYINFTRKDIGIALRTTDFISLDANSFLFNDNTGVMEVANPSNVRTLGTISFLSQVTVEYGGLTVAKNGTVNFGESIINNPKQNDFVLKNTGVGKLLLSGTEPVIISGDADAVFSVAQPSSSEIESGDFLPFRINFNPKSEQVYTATVTISSNDQSGGFIFSITANGVSPKPIATVLYENSEIAQNGTINAGEVLITQSKNITVILKNTGTTVLTVDTAGVVITGSDAAAFTKLTNPGSNISPEGESSFIIEYKPVSQGGNNAILTIPTNDGSRNPVVVFLMGTGLQGSPIMELRQDSSIITSGSVTPFDFGTVLVGENRTFIFTIENKGDIALELTGTPMVDSSNAVFAVSTQPASRTINPGVTAQFILRYQPAVEGQNFSQITISNNSNQAIFEFNVIGNGYVPKPAAKILYETNEILQDGTIDAGEAIITYSKTITVAIRNTGDATLTVDTANITITGVDAASFSRTTSPNANIQAGNQTTFNIECIPAKVGENNAILTIPTNDTSRNPVTVSLKIIGLSGSGILDLSHGGTAVINNSLNPIDFETIELGFNKDITFTLKNTGNLPLVLTGTPAVQSSNAVFSIPVMPALTINQGGETSFIIRYSPITEGEDIGIITIANDSSGGLFTFRVGGTGYERRPQIGVSQGTTAINVNGEYNFSTVTIGEPQQVIFTIGNSGDANLTFNGDISLSGANAGLFSIVQPASTSVPPEGTTTFAISFSPIAEGANFTATALISTNSRNNGQFSFTVSGNSYERKPQITVHQGVNEININGNHNFGTVTIGEPNAITFIIGNSGDANLTFEPVNGNRVNLENNAGNHFSLTQPSVAFITPGGSTTFTITFNPLSAGNNFTANVKIRTNCQDNEEFSFAISGNSMLAVPSGLTAVSQTSDSILISWNMVPGATSYKVYYGTSSSNISTVANSAVVGTSYSHTGLLAGTTYFYNISAQDEANESARSQNVSTITIPGIPVNFRSTDPSSSSIYLRWDAVTGASNYRVYYATSAEGSKTILSGNISYLYYNHSGLPSNTTYYYFVTAVNSSGEGAYSEVLAERTLLAPLAAPNNVTATALSTSSIQVSWNAVAEAINYKVYRSTGQYGTQTLLDTVTTTSYTDSSSFSATLNYWYFVTAMNADEVESGSGISNPVNVMPNIPFNVNAVAESGINGNRVRVSWTSVTGATGYRIYAGTSSTGSDRVLIYTITSGSASYSYHTTGLPNTTYYYWVTAFNLGGESDYSLQTSATFP